MDSEIEIRSLIAYFGGKIVTNKALVEIIGNLSNLT